MPSDAITFTYYIHTNTTITRQQAAKQARRQRAEMHMHINIIGSASLEWRSILSRGFEARRKLVLVACRIIVKDWISNIIVSFV